MPLQNHPQIFTTLGMVLALYGVLYLDVALRPERGFLIAAVGLAGKIFGPLGRLWLFSTRSVAGLLRDPRGHQRPGVVDPVRRLSGGRLAELVARRSHRFQN